MIELIDKLQMTHRLSKDEWIAVIDRRSPDTDVYLADCARSVRHRYYGRDVYIRGLIEFTNYCRNDCFYCGIRRSNLQVRRYRLSKEQILACCQAGYKLGFRTFVLQGGEDGFFDDERMVDLITAIRSGYPDCAITLSIGEGSYDSYEAYYKAGANRFLLRHETFNREHYDSLHPPKLTAKRRQQCLFDLKKIGYQVGTGFMVGSPGQTTEHLAEDMLFLEKLKPHMVGIGPFIPHHATPFKDRKPGSADLTIHMLSLIRLMLPKVLLPSTTALGSIAADGRIRGILAGANVVMPNLSPADFRADYSLYDNKAYSGSEAAESLHILRQQMETIDYQIVSARGDALM